MRGRCIAGTALRGQHCGDGARKQSKKVVDERVIAVTIRDLAHGVAESIDSPCFLSRLMCELVSLVGATLGLGLCIHG